MDYDFNFDYLDTLVLSVKKGERHVVDALTTNQRIYVALASGHLDLIPDFSVARAINHLGFERTEMMVHRWRDR